MRARRRQVVQSLLTISTKDLENLGMWEPLQDLLASSSEDVKVQALWVIGTAVQNNPAAQKAVRPVIHHEPRKSATHRT